MSRTRERHAAVHDLLQAGHTQRETARILGLDPGTVSRFAREPGPAALLVKATGRDSKLDPFKHTSTSGRTRASPTPPSCTLAVALLNGPTVLL